LTQHQRHIAEAHQQEMMRDEGSCSVLVLKCSIMY
jgi:hypothetical protein